VRRSLAEESAKKYYLETRGDVLLRNKEVFRFWKKLGLSQIFLGIEAIDEDGLRKFRKRVPLGRNFEALEFARSLGIGVAINIIADPDWDEERFRILRDWCMDVPEVVNVSVNTPYPGTETWLSEQCRLATRDYRLFDIQHAVLPTKLPIATFYRELLQTQRVLYRKHMNWWTAPILARELAQNLLRGQTNFMRGILNYRKVYNADKMLADHSRPIQYHCRCHSNQTLLFRKRKAHNFTFTPSETAPPAALIIPPSSSLMRRAWGCLIEHQTKSLSLDPAAPRRERWHWAEPRAGHLVRGRGFPSVF